MSKHQAPVGLAIEWSPRGVVSYDVRTRERRNFADGEPLPFAGRDAILALSRGSVFVRTARVPNAAPDEVRTILLLRLGDLFPLPAHELAFDFYLTNDVNEDAGLALVAAVPAVELRRAMAQMHASNVKVKKVVPSALGSALVAQSLSLNDAAVVERTESGSTIDLVSDGILRTSRVASPAAPLDVEISRTCALAALPCVSTLATGGTNFEGVDVRTEHTALEALATSWPDRLRLNLELPEVLAARADQAVKNRQRQAFLILISAFCVAALAYSNYSEAAESVQSENSHAASRVRQAKTLQTAAESDLTKVSAVASQLSQAFAPAQKIGDVVTVASNLVPGGVWLSGVTLERGKPMVLRGTATTNAGISSYLDALANEPQHRFRDVKLVFANNSEIDKKPVVQFSLSAFPVGNLPLAQPGKTTSGAAGGTNP